MARNEEKANAMLNRFLAMKADDAKGVKEKRPYLATLCDNLVQAEKWRMQIVKEIGKKVAIIQNPGHGEFQLREMNDEINKLIREKYHWEKRIRELGGPDYRISSAKDIEVGEELIGSGGYKYFGAAKDLPGVRELLERAEAKSLKRTRKDMYEGIDPDYYGYRDEDDGILLPLEEKAEKEIRQRVINEWKNRKELSFEQGGPSKKAKAIIAQNEVDLMDNIEVQGFVALVPLPKQEDIERVVLEKKKKELLSKYVSEDLQKQEEVSKSLLNIKTK
eukprot:c6117_g1_i1.p1 GENE.c6117_g1_i1~~c6117_g1_i1.p1  ORF type:complete len:276 (-),score=118.06 c6117_g1_i1:25-852(-)